MQIGVSDLTKPLDRFALHGDDCIDIALLQHFDRESRLDVEQVRPDPQALEHIDRGYKGAAVRKVNGNRLAVEVSHGPNRTWREDVHFLVEELGNVDELVTD